MNLTISLYSETQQYQDYCNVKEKDHIKININSKKKEMLKRKSLLLLLLFWFDKNQSRLGPYNKKLICFCLTIINKI